MEFVADFTDGDPVYLPYDGRVNLAVAYSELPPGGELVGYFHQKGPEALDRALKERGIIKT